VNAPAEFFDTRFFYCSGFSPSLANKARFFGSSSGFGCADFSPVAFFPWTAPLFDVLDLMKSYSSARLSFLMWSYPTPPPQPSPTWRRCQNFGGVFPLSRASAGAALTSSRTTMAKCVVASGLFPPLPSPGFLLAAF